MFSEAQHGFRSGRSTSSALLVLTEEVTNALEAGESLMLTLCDLSKAFDVVTHDILIGKLAAYGIGGPVLRSLISFLSNRKQVVTIMGARSGVRSVEHGVPQGSVLGPLLFLILINDLGLNGRTLLFADDTTLWTKNRDLRQLRIEAEELLAQAKQWFEANKLKVNEEKTQQLLCTLGSVAAEEVEGAVKLLGFWVDHKMNWKHHVAQVCTKLSRVIWLIKKLRNLVTEPYLLQVYHSLFHSHILYGLLLWGHSTDVNDVLLLQKKAVRAVSSSDRLDHCRPLFCRLDILTVYSQFVYNSLSWVRDNVESLVKRSDFHQHNTRRADDINIPRCRLARTKNSFPSVAIQMFNALPRDIRLLAPGLFKKSVRRALVKRPLYSLTELEEEPLFHT